MIETAVCLAGASAAMPAPVTTSNNRMIPENKFVTVRNRLSIPLMRWVMAVSDSSFAPNMAAQRVLSLQRNCVRGGTR
jgi:hypothetical protein